MINNVEPSSTKKHLLNVLYYIIGITAALFFIKGLQITKLEYILLVIVPINYLIKLSAGQKMSLEQLTFFVSIIWLTFLFFQVTGVLFGFIGILIAMIGFTIFIVIRAVTSSYFKDSLVSMQPRFNEATPWMKKLKMKRRRK